MPSWQGECNIKHLMFHSAARRPAALAGLCEDRVKPDDTLFMALQRAFRPVKNICVILSNELEGLLNMCSCSVV